MPKVHVPIGLNVTWIIGIHKERSKQILNLRTNYHESRQNYVTMCAKIHTINYTLNRIIEL
jgi:hypothetical protein